MDLLAFIMALKAQGMTAAQITEAVNEYLEDHPDALDQAAVEAILDGRLDVIDNELSTVKSAIEDLEAGSLSALGAANNQVPTAHGNGTWTWENQQGGGGGEKPWNHTTFAVIDASEETTAFTVVNSGTITELKITGTIEANSYDDFCIFSDAEVLINLGRPSSTNKNFGFASHRINDVWISHRSFSQYIAYSAIFNNYIPPNNSDDGTHDITIGFRWKNIALLTGTTFDVWWR